MGISEHDFDVSVARARRLLASSVDVRVSVTGVEAPQESLAQDLLNRFLSSLEGVSMGFTPARRECRELASVVWAL